MMKIRNIEMWPTEQANKALMQFRPDTVQASNGFWKDDPVFQEHDVREVLALRDRALEPSWLRFHVTGEVYEELVKKHWFVDFNELEWTLREEIDKLEALLVDVNELSDDEDDNYDCTDCGEPLSILEIATLSTACNACVVPY